jgi:uncharacterized membrane protein (UPF0127 family)
LHIHRAESFAARLLGVWRRPLAEHEGLLLAPCRAVHTLGLRFDLDVLFLDAQGKLLRSVFDLKPNRAAWHPKARAVVELPGGYCRRHPGYALAVREALRA